MKKAGRFATSFFIALLICLTTAFAQEEAEGGEGEISFEELQKTRAAHLFKLGKYQEALGEFEKLSQTYPADTLPRRYTGMTLTLLGRLDEAISIYQESLGREPENPALHYYLARVYHEQGAKDKAKEELEEVLRLDPEGFYGQPARIAIPVVERRRLVEKPWDVWIASGYEYDSNVTLAPNDKALRGTDDESAGRYYLALGGKYKWFQRGRFDSHAGYRLYRSFHDDSLNEFNYTFQEFFLINEYRSMIFNREVKWGLRDSIPLGFLAGNLFSWGNELTFYVNGRVTKNTFTELFHRYSHIEFGPDGAIPNLTARDGEYNSTGIHHRFYFSNLTRYVFVGYEFQTAATQGNNFDRVGHFFQVGLNTPITKKLVFNVTGSFVTADYPHYSAEIAPIEPLARRDHDWVLFTSLTYNLTRNWSLQGFYRYGNSNNRNDIFQHDRQIGGVELLFRY